MENLPKTKAPGDPYDMNGHNFNPDIYLQKLLKDKSLDELMDQEKRIVHDTQKLHSDMQTLVYENYNKFISATDTIKKMKSDFKQMETEMDLLAKNMDSITSFSDQISNTLQDTRQQISKLSGVHSLLKRLQFLFKLPNKLKSLMHEGNHAQAVQDYLHTQQVLNHYAHLESFRGIQSDCMQIVEELKSHLRDQLKNRETTAKDLTQSVELLLLLGEPAENLYLEILTHASKRLKDQLELLSFDISGQDMIEFVDMINNGFLSDLCLVVTSYNDLFVHLPEPRQYSTLASNKLNEFVKERMGELMNCVVRRVKIEQEKSDMAITIRALDRFYSSLNALASLFNHTEFSKQGIELILSAGSRACQLGKENLESHLDECIRTVRQGLATQSTGLAVQNPSHQDTASQLLSSLVLTTVERVKTILHELTMFAEPELSFSCDPRFGPSFSVDCVRGEFVMGFLQSVVTKARSYTESQGPSPATLLVLAKMCLEFQSTHINYIFSLVEEWFTIPERKSFAKEKQEICDKMHQAAQDLVNHYVRVEGNTISQMLRKSVETRDWVHSLEPRTVRAVMKRVLEEIASVDSQVGGLFEEGTRADRSSDSSRRTSRRANWAPHVHKLFSERIEIFAPVQFSKVSILTGIIKISLKTLLECVRLRTFSKFGLQQIQVDTHYLQLYLWRYVSDENLVHLLLDEILGSAVHRCMNPALMEPSVVEIICERG